MVSEYTFRQGKDVNTLKQSFVHFHSRIDVSNFPKMQIF